MGFQLTRSKFSTSRMLIIVTVYFSMAFKAYRDSIFYFITATLCAWLHVISLNLYTTKSMAYAASPMTLR